MTLGSWKKADNWDDFLKLNIRPQQSNFRPYRSNFCFKKKTNNMALCVLWMIDSYMDATSLVKKYLERQEPDQTNWSGSDMYLIWKFERYLVCNWYVIFDPRSKILIGEYGGFWSEFDQYTDRTGIKFFDRIVTSNPINKISNVWSGRSLKAALVLTPPRRLPVQYTAPITTLRAGKRMNQTG
jgi:hypothetical protein